MSKVSVINRFWALLSPDYKEIRNVYIFAIFSGILSLGLPLGIQMIINFIQLGQVSTSWFVLVGLVVIAVGFSGVLNIYQLRITENLQQRIFTRSAFEFSERIPKMKMELLLKRYTPEITNRFFDTLTIQKGLSKILIDSSAAILQIVFGLILLSFYHSFFIFLGLVLILLLIVIIRVTSKKAFNSSMEESTYKYKIANWLDEITQARLSFKMAGFSLFNLNQTNKLVNNYLSAREKHFKILVQQYGYLIVFKVVIALALLIVGGLLVLNQQMNIGQFVAAEIIILLILNSVEKLILSLEIFYDVFTSIEKIGQVTDLSLEKVSGAEFENLNNGMELKISDLSYSFTNYQTPILEDVSIGIKSNERVCFVSDSSLSTNVLFCLISGMYDFQKGTISFNDIPISNLDKNSYRDQIGTLLSQDQFVNASIYENIAFGRDEVDLKTVTQIATSLDLGQFIDQITDKYNAVINPERNMLPGDIATRLLFARAIVSNPSLMLLEDPTSGMNEIQTKYMAEKIKSLSNTTTLIASFEDEVHRISDRIIEIKEGKIVFVGNYNDYQNRKQC
ncbi:MAG: peptidase domain-containing ABC transporter [Crocinitomicaceae bacterium]|jgi:ABC-type bacteriocin/lantibiotic exporter with double-glycine peptidase domain